MHQIYKYDLYIFDCDGVILDSNKLKVLAMREALETFRFSPELVNQCVDYFANNFGKSRFHHIDHFVNNILGLRNEIKSEVKEKMLCYFSAQCKSLYLTAELTPGFLPFIQRLPGKKFVASGSEQNELRSVFEQRELSDYFVDILGSPASKSQLLQTILNRHSYTQALMIGDAESDFEASRINKIDFMCYIPLSNVGSHMNNLAHKFGFTVLECWPDKCGVNNG